MEAVALGHDLGHTPFGHAGERALDRACPLGFRHNEQSVRTVDLLEKDGQGINLTVEVRDGILNHQTASMPATLEGRIVRLADKIAYIHHDTDDAIRGGIMKESDVPKEVSSVAGHSCTQRLDYFIHNIVINSRGRDEICMSEEAEEAMRTMREFMFRNVYRNPIAKGQENKAEGLVVTLYEYYMNHTEKLPKFLYRLMEEGEPLERIVCDYIGSMTDRFAIAQYQEIYIPKTWHG